MLIFQTSLTGKQLKFKERPFEQWLSCLINLVTLIYILFWRGRTAIESVANHIGYANHIWLMIYDELNLESGGNEIRTSLNWLRTLFTPLIRQFLDGWSWDSNEGGASSHPYLCDELLPYPDNPFEGYWEDGPSILHWLS